MLNLSPSVPPERAPRDGPRAPSTAIASPPFRRTFRWLTIFRVLLFGAALSVVAFELVSPPLQGTFSYSTSLALGAFIVAVLSSTVASLLLAAGAKARSLLLGTLLIDQALWTVMVYLSGGPASGATVLYGISCIVGGIVLGVPGAMASALSGGVFYSLLTLLVQAKTLPVPTDQPSRSYALHPDDITFHVVINLLALLFVALLVSNLSERLQRTRGALVDAEDRAHRAERMAALGRLSLGLAHEIRNPLSAISGSVQMLRTSAIDEDDRQLCEIVLRESQRLEELVSDMLDLARPRPPDFAPVAVGPLLRDVVQLARVSGRATSDVEVELIAPDEEVFTVWADGGQLRQLVWNLVRNAVQASEARGEVRVRLSGNADQVNVAVEDDGSGIDSQARLHLFDAYYTTRSNGTGIGLAVVKRIADEHGFSVEVPTGQSGATFLLRMPRYHEENSR